jgi:hypothetical protein
LFHRGKAHHVFTRRKLLTGVALGGLAVGLGGRSALAFSVAPMTKPVAAAFALRCMPATAGGGDHAQLIAAVQAILKGKIVNGAAPADVEQAVICPICGCRIIVTADASY